MAKIAILTIAVFFTFGFMVSNGYAEEQAVMSMGKPSPMSSMVGTSILNPKGDYLGGVSDFVIDPQGHVTFVVVSHGGFLRMGGKESSRSVWFLFLRQGEKALCFGFNPRGAGHGPGLYQAGSLQREVG